MTGTNIATYNLQVFSPPSRYVVEGDPTYTQPGETDQDKRILADLPAKLEALEEMLEGSLPEGYAVRITEWNK